MPALVVGAVWVWPELGYLKYKSKKVNDNFQPAFSSFLFCYSYISNVAN